MKNTRPAGAAGEDRDGEERSVRQKVGGGEESTVPTPSVPPAEVGDDVGLPAAAAADEPAASSSSVAALLLLRPTCGAPNCTGICGSGACGFLSSLPRRGPSSGPSSRHLIFTTFPSLSSSVAASSSSSSVASSSSSPSPAASSSPAAVDAQMVADGWETYICLE